MKDIGKIINTLFSVRDNMKIYHWSTKSYSRHIATDTFVNKLSEKIDTFIEVLQGSRGSSNLKINSSIKLENISDSEAFNLLIEYKNWLSKKLPKYLFSYETDLLNLRDEMLQDVNLTLYLFKLK